MVMKRDLYNEVGGFDEDCFMYSDDIDLSYMVLKNGKTNYYFSETTVIHYKGESTIKDEKYMKRFVMTSLIAYVRRMLDEFMPDKCESMVSENSVEFANVMNVKVKNLQIEGPREKYTKAIRDNNQRIRELTGNDGNTEDGKAELQKLTRAVYEDNVRLLKYNIFYLFFQLN